MLKSKLLAKTAKDGDQPNEYEATFDSVRIDKKTHIQMRLTKDSVKKIDLELELNNSHEKSGKLSLNTAWSCIKTVEAKYNLILGPEVQIGTEIKHNGQQLLALQSKLIMSKSRAVIEVEMDHVWGSTVTGRAAFEKSLDSLEMDSTFKVGEQGYSSRGKLVTLQGQIDASLVFEAGCETNKMFFNFDLASNSQKTSLRSNLENQQTTLFLAKFDKEAFTTGLEVLVLDHAVTFVLKTKDDFLLDAEYLKQSTVMSKVTMSLDKKRDPRNMDEDLNLKALLILPDSDTYGIEFSNIHRRTEPTKTSVKITMGSKAVIVNNSFQWGVPGNALMLEGKLTVESPYEALSSVTVVYSSSMGYEAQKATGSIHWIRHFQARDMSFDLTRTKVDGKHILSLDSTLDGKSFLAEGELEFHGREFDFKLSLGWSDGTKMEFGAKHAITDELGHEIRLLVPYLQEIVVTIDPVSKQKSGLDTPLDMYQGIEVTVLSGEDLFGSFKMFGGFKINKSLVLNMELMSPHYDVSKKTIVLDLKRDLESVQSNLRYADEDRNMVYELVGSGNVKSGLYNISLKTPCEHIRVLDLNAQILDLDDKFSVQMNGKLNENSKLALDFSLEHGSSITKALLKADSSLEWIPGQWVFRGEYNHTNHSLSIYGNMSGDQMMKALFSPNSSGFEVEMDLLGNLVNFNLNGKYDGSGPIKTINFSGTSKDNTIDLKINSQVSELDGNLDVFLSIPHLELIETAQIEYEMSDNLGQVRADFNGKKYEMSWTYTAQRSTLVLETPVPGYEIVSAVYWSDSSKKRLEISVNNDQVAKLGLRCEGWKDFGLDAEVNHSEFPINRINLELKANQMTDAKIGAMVLCQSGKHEFELRNYLAPSRTHMDFNLHFQGPKQTQKLNGHFLFFFNDRQDPFDRLDIGLELADKNFILVLSGTPSGQYNGSVKISTYFNSTVIGNTGPKHGQDPKFVIDIHLPPLNFNSNMKITETDEQKGQLTFKTYFMRRVLVDVELDYNLADSPTGQRKSVSLKATAGSSTLTLDGNFELGTDNFDGTFIWTSNIPGHEEAKLFLKYNIAAEPSVSLTLDKKGSISEIKAKVNLETVIPTFTISTPFRGYEKIVLRGDYKLSQQPREPSRIDFEVNINGAAVVVFNNKFLFSSDYSNFEITSNMITPIENWTSMNLQVGWKNQDPYGLKMKFTREGVEYSVVGKISMSRKELLIVVSTPHEGFEYLRLHGRFGSTSTVQKFMMSYPNNKVKRELGFEYGIEDQTAFMRMKTPMDSLRSVSVKSSMLADSGSQLDFDFETEGENNDFNFGLKYDFSQGFSTASVKAKMQHPQLKPAVEVALDYKNVDGNFENGFEGEFQIKRGTDKLIHLKIDRVPGKTVVKGKVPVPGYEKFKIELTSDYKERIEMSFTTPDKTYSLLALKNGPEDFAFTIKTPQPGYKTVQVDYKKNPSTEERKVIATRDGIKITDLTITPLMKKPKFGVMVDWKATASIWVKLDFVFHHEDDLNQLNFELTTPFEKCKKLRLFIKSDVSLKADENENRETKTEVQFDYNELFFTYLETTKMVSNDQGLKYQSNASRKTNIKFFDYKQSVTETIVEVSSAYDSVKVTSNRKDDDVEVYKVELEFQYKMWKAFQLKVKGSHALLLPQGFHGELKVAVDPGKQIRIMVTANEKSVKIELKKNRDQMMAKMTSNIPGFENLEGKLKTRRDDKKRRHDFSLELNGDRFLTGLLSYDKDPVSKAKFALKVADFVDQQVSIELDSSHTGFKIQTKGSHSNLDIEVKWQPFSGKSMDVLVTIKGTSYILMYQEVDITGRLQFELENTAEERIGKLTLTLKESIGGSPMRDWLLKGQLKTLVESSGFSAMAKLTTPFSPESNLELEFGLADITSRSIDCNLAAKVEVVGVIKYQLKSVIIWSIEKANLSLNVEGNDLKINISAVRDSYKSIEILIDVNGFNIEYRNTNDIRGPKDFNVSAMLKLPIEFAKTYELTVSSSSQTNGMKAQAKASWDTKAIMMTYVKESGDYHLNIETPFEKYSKLTLDRTEAGKGHVTVLGLGPHEVKLKELVKINHGPAILDLELISSVFIDKMLFKLNEADRTGKFSVKKGANHLCIDVKADKTGAELEIRSNYLPKEKVNITIKKDESDHKIELTGSHGGVRAVHLMAEMPGWFNSEGGEANLDLKTGGDLPELSVAISCQYKLNLPRDIEANFKMISNGKTLEFSFKKWVEGGMSKLEFQLESPLDTLRHLEAEFETEDGYGNLEIEYGLEGSPDHLKLELTTKAVRGKNGDAKLSIELDGEEILELMAAADIVQNTFESKLVWKDQEMTLNGRVEGEEVSMELKSPFENFKNVEASGTWKKTDNGAVFRATGDVDSIGHAIVLEYKLDSNLFEMNWRADRGSKYIEFESLFELSSNSPEGSMTLRSSEFSPCTVDLKVTKGDMKLETKVKVVTPLKRMKNIDGHLMLEYTDQKKGMIASIKTDRPIIDIQAVVGRQGNGGGTFKFGAAVPALGIDENTFMIELTYKPMSMSDDPKEFEIFGEFTFAGTPRKIGINVKQEGPYDFDATMTFVGFGREVVLRIGNKIKYSDDLFKWQANLNDIKLQVSFDNSILHSTVRLMIEPIEGVVELPKVSLDMEYRHEESFRLQMDAGPGRLVSSKFVMLGRKVMGMVEVDFDGFKRTGSLKMEFGAKGRFEVTFGDSKSGIEMQMRNKRSARAAFFSEEFGNYEFDLDEKMSKGVLVLTTAHGFHKISYDVKDTNGWDVTLEMESPWLANGKAVAKVHLDTSKNDYKVFMSSYQEHLLSGSLNFDQNGFAFSTTLQSKWMPHDFDLSIMTRLLADGIRSSVSCNVAGSEHKFNLMAKNFAMTVKLSSPFIIGSVWSLESKASLFGMNRAADLTINIGNDIKVVVSGQATVRDCQDFSGSVTIHSPNYDFLNFKVLFGVNFNDPSDSIRPLKVLTLRLIPVSGYPVPDLGLEVSAMTKDQRNVMDFELKLPKMDSLSGTLSIPKSGWTKNQITLKVHFKDRQHQIKTEWDLADTRHLAASLTYNDDFKNQVLVEAKAKMSHSVQDPRFHLVLIAETTCEQFSKARLELVSQEGFSRNHSDLSTTLTWNDEKIIVDLLYNFQMGRKELIVATETPFSGKRGLKLAYENGPYRKTAKAHVTTPSNGIGVEVDFKYHSIHDFLIDVTLDIPIEGLHLKHVLLEHKKTTQGSQKMAFGGKWKSQVVKVDYHWKKNSLIKLGYILGDSDVPTTTLTLEGMREDGQWGGQVAGRNIFFLNHDLEVKFVPNSEARIVWDNMDIFKVKVIRATGEIEVEGRFNTYTIKGSSTLESDALLTNVEFQPEILGLPCQISSIWRTNRVSKKEGSILLTWPNGDTMRTMFDTKFQQDKMLKFVLKTFQNNVQVFGLDHQHEENYDSSEIKEKSCLTIPSHVFCLKSESSHAYGELIRFDHDAVWGTIDEPASKGLRLTYWKDQTWETGTKETGFQIKRLIDGSGTEAYLSAHLRQEGATLTTIEIKSVDPRPLNLDFSVVVSYFLPGR